MFPFECWDILRIWYLWPSRYCWTRTPKNLSKPGQRFLIVEFCTYQLTYPCCYRTRGMLCVPGEQINTFVGLPVPSPCDKLMKFYWEHFISWITITFSEIALEVWNTQSLNIWTLSYVTFYHRTNFAQPQLDDITSFSSCHV